MKSGVWVCALLMMLLVQASWAATGEAVAPDGVAIAYETFGEASADGPPAVVLIHGWCCDRGYWRMQTAALAVDRLVVAVDLAGHGASGLEREDYTMAAFGADVAAVVRALELDKVILVGHSMGGTVAVEAGAQLPGRVVGLVGIDTLQDVGFGYPPAAVDAFLLPAQEDFPGFTDRFVRSMFPRNADPALVDEIAGDMSSAPPRVAVSAMRHLLLNDLHVALEKTRAPIICIDGALHPVKRESWEFYQPGYDAVIMEGVGHFPMREMPEEFTGQLQDVLARF